MRLLLLLHPIVRLALVASLVLWGCSGSPTPPNRPPSVRLLVAPPENATVSYRVPLSWEGSDPDGRVIRYELLVDPDPRFSEEEIAWADTLGFPIEIGDGVTRVSKPVAGGDPAVLEWVHRTDRHAVLTFTADELDNRTLPRDRPRFVRPHRIYLRAVDDAGAVSLPARTAFTARTLAPRTFLRYPEVPGSDWTPSMLLIPRDTPILPGAEDVDGTATGYLVRSVPLCSEPEPGDRLPYVHELFPGEDVEGWTFFPADPGGLLVPVPECGVLSPARAYAVAIRAVDAAGAYDPFLEWGRNVLPLLDRKSTRLALRLELADGPCAEGRRVVVVDGLTPRLIALASADPEGRPLEIRHGLDVASDDAPGWSAWIPGSRLTLPPLPLEEPGVHRLVVQARNRFGIRTSSRIEVEVPEDVPRGTTVLLVDDYHDGTRAADAVHDGFWQDRLLAAGLSPDDLVIHDPFGAGDALYLDPRPLAPGDLLPHRAVIWNVRGSGYSRRTGLSHTLCTITLDLYHRSGGHLWLLGESGVAATVPDDRGDAAFYPVDLHPGTFAWDVLRLRSHEVRNDGRTNRRDHGLVAVDPHPEGPGWPGLTRDDTKLPEELRPFGTGDCDAVFGPLDPAGGLREAVYVYGAHGPRRLGRPSPYEGRVNGLRWHDPDPAASAGRTVWFGFPLHLFHDGEAQGVVDGVLAWFGETMP